MDNAIRTFLEHMEQRLASKSDVVGLEQRLLAHVDESQESLALMVNSGFAQMQSQHTEVLSMLYRIADAVDVDMTFQWNQSEVEMLETYRREIDALTSRVKALETRPRTKQ